MKRLIYTLLGLLGVGVSGCDDGSDGGRMVAYGVPHVDFRLTARVVDSEGNPIQGMDTSNNLIVLDLINNRSVKILSFQLFLLPYLHPHHFPPSNILLVINLLVLKFLHNILDLVYSNYYIHTLYKIKSLLEKVLPNQFYFLLQFVETMDLLLK